MRILLVGKGGQVGDELQRARAPIGEIVGQAARRLGADVVHDSTDDVFDGTNVGAYEKFGRTSPVSVYGATDGFPCDLYHVAAGETLWHAFAQAVVRGAISRGKALPLSPEAIRPSRRADGRLECRR